MSKRIAVAVLVVFALGIAGQVWSNARTDDPLGVAVSPQTLILSRDQGGAVTVHTSIQFAAVDPTSLTLNGVPSTSVRADDCGNVVGRFNESAVEATVAPPSALLLLEGAMLDGAAFAGSDMVQVKE